MVDVDFSFACDMAESAASPWGHLEVVELRGQEAISEPYRYDLTLAIRAPAPEVDPRDLLGKRATLRIRTSASPAFKVVHGILVEAEELFETPDAMLYKVTLAPPWVRAMHRTRSRVFLDKTLAEIVDAVLQGDPLMQLRDGAEIEEEDGAPVYAPATELFTWRVRDTVRRDDRRARPFVVQYNESDFAFVSRLLEEEGISYHFEQGRGACLLVLTDNDGGRPRPPGGALGAGILGREIAEVRLGGRLRASGVVLGEYNWKKPKLAMVVRAGEEAAEALSEYHYPGGYPDGPGQGAPLAVARADRQRTEARYAVGEGTARMLGGGSVFLLEHDDADHEGEYVVTRLDVHGEQQGVIYQASGAQEKPWGARFELARRGSGAQVEESRFRPALRTAKPRIQGTQTAVVTASPGAAGAEVNVGGPDGLGVGCVHVRFRWDTDQARLAKEPSSVWVRVSQVFAGAGEGAVWHPRVGDEVLVDFEEGDPDRPVVVGRLYNGANLPARTAPHESSMKSLSTPGGGTYNEIMFGDASGGEVLHTYAGKDQTTDVANFRREGIGGNATMVIGGNNTESIGGNRTESIGGDDTLTIGANQTLTIGGNATAIIGANFTHTVGANEVNLVGGAQLVRVGANLQETVAGAVAETYGASRTTTVGGAVTESYGALMSVTVGGNVDESCASHAVTVSAARLMMIGGNYTTVVGGASTLGVGAVMIEASGGPQNLTVAGNILRKAPLHLTSAAHEEDIKSAKLSALTTSTTIHGVALELVGMTRTVNGVKKSNNGIELDADGYKNKPCGRIIRAAPVGFIASGADNQTGGKLDV
ncbi:type VI secretion system Vgr family protein [Chondromyces apiculatus]|uniref:VgrG protein n=1 Tax=Chondromyces apiculatus DSM 436 TaxID=1192034 RepID=A0A017T7A5_9BACT|nr:type VI secretion system tip protein TssI/VgrG [Chondromyces apiculatus]EYF05094.1 VgrG protein [Chondromyces apiculatus DSM 436]